MLRSLPLPLLPLLAACALVACDTAAPAPPTAPVQATGEGAPAEAQVDLPLGDVEVDDQKADGVWGHATECKPIPDLPPLTDPAIVISLDGLTLHLTDRAGGYDRVFPIGVGQLEDGASLTPTSASAAGGLFHTRTDAPPVFDGPTPEQAAWGWNHQCRMWWSDEDGAKVPVFAGLPFIRLTGPASSSYGIHGPIDRYTQANGGTLRRGYVSHGCVRMEAADIVEVYARIQGHSAPVRLQQAVERDASDAAVDVADNWLGAECASDADCRFAGGICNSNGYSGRGFCTQRCARYCPDRYGYPVSFCVDDPSAPGEGMCVNKVSAVHGGCPEHASLTAHPSVSRHGQAWKRADVCLPGTEGWIGDRCLADGDCLTDHCRPVDGGPAGVCTEPCSRYCPDLAGHATTFCIGADAASGLSGGMCVAQCKSNADCALGTTCEAEARHSMAWVVRNVCVPY